MLNMLLKDPRINNPIPREHRPDKLSRARPHVPVRNEDTIPQELSPLLMERLALAKVPELESQHSLNVLRVCRYDYPIRDTCVYLGGLRVVDLVRGVGDFDRVAPVFDIFVGSVGFAGFDDEVDCWCCQCFSVEYVDGGTYRMECETGSGELWFLCVRSQRRPVLCEADRRERKVL